MSSFSSPEAQYVAEACIKNKNTIAKASYTLIMTTFMTLSINSHQQLRLQKALLKVSIAHF